MKKIILVSGILGAAAAMAATERTQEIQAYRIGGCDFWTYVQEARGYVCASYPQTITVPDAYSVSNENQQLRARIDDLEKRVKALEQHHE